MKILILLSLVFYTTAYSEEDLYPLTERERAGYEVFVKNGRLIDIDGVPIDTRGYFGFHHFAPFIIQDNRIYGVEFNKPYFLTHKNLSLGRYTQAKGYWKAEAGIVIAIRLSLPCKDALNSGLPQFLMKDVLTRFK